MPHARWQPGPPDSLRPWPAEEAPWQLAVGSVQKSTKRAQHAVLRDSQNADKYWTVDSTCHSMLVPLDDSSIDVVPYYD
jgi:hypothetical protein